METLQPSTDLWAFVVKGGPVMVPILALSVVACGIVFDRYWTLWRFRRRLLALAERVTAQVDAGKAAEALRDCQSRDTALDTLFATALVHRAQHPDEIARRLERPGADVVAELEAYMGGLATIVGIEPLLGFLGTIIGMIEAFMGWERLGESVTINALAGGIYEAMITTAAGLIVAIPYYMAYNHLVARIAALTRQTEKTAEALVDLLSRGAKRETILRAV
jgi:biopolymer transport protein ExbB